MTLVAGSIESGDVTYEYVKGHPVRYIQDGDMFFRSGTVDSVIDVLKRAKYQGFRIRLFYGDTKSGESWMEESYTMGSVGSSMGPLKVPLLIQRSYSMGGDAIRADSIVRIQSMSGKDLYRHPTFYVPEMTVVKRKEPLQQRRGSPLTHEVWVNEEAHGAFSCENAAKQWIAFMKGERQRPW